MTDETLDFARLVQILRHMAHDLRGPLGVLIATSDLMVQGGYGELNPKQEKAAKRLRRSSGRAIALLDDFMTYIKAEAQQLPLEIKAFNPQMLVAELVKTVQPEAQAKNLTIRIVNGENLPPDLWGDASLIGRVVLALLWNAVAFSEQGEITLCSSWDPASSVWKLKVCDQGTGIVPDNVPHIFELFWRQAEQTQSATSGCGVGLSMARSVAHVMNGQLTLEKTGPQGSEFCLCLPLPSEFAGDAASSENKQGKPPCS
jgi:signal transduction histidine kinase